MNRKLISLYHYEDFPVFWEVLDDKTTLLSSELFDLNINHEVNQGNISEIVNQIIVELYSDVITFH
jgi:hypothetical protein